eukprot:196328_1
MTLCHSQYYYCGTINGCSYQNMYCNSTNCTVDCIRNTYACRDLIINGGNSNVVVNCQYRACGNIKIYAKTAKSLIVNNDINDPDNVQYTYIECPQNTYCNITATNAGSALYSTIINATIGSKLFIKAYGFAVMQNTKIYCPPDIDPGPQYTNDAICDISVLSNPNSAYDRAMDNVRIFANEGFHNVKVKCENAENNGCYGKGKEPKLYCGESLDVYCVLQSQTNSSELVCGTNSCNQLLPSLSPSLSPTLGPTTSHPTFTPTKYDPYEEPIHTLYISNNGCDYGICDTNDFDANSFCHLKGIHTSDKYSNCCNNISFTPTQTFASS